MPPVKKTKSKTILSENTRSVAKKTCVKAKNTFKKRNVVSTKNVVAPTAPISKNKKVESELEKVKRELETALAEVDRLRAELAKAKKEKNNVVIDNNQKSTRNTSFKTKPSNGEGVLPGIFVLADGRKIRFAKGNLQFHCAKHEFRFAEHQYDFIGEANTKISPNYNGRIDLFGWGTSGYMGCQPTEISSNAEEYGPSSGSLDGTNYDWGVFNPIVNGGDKEAMWRSMTRDEWWWINSSRPNATKLKAFGTVCGVKGLIILPDNFWSNSMRLSIDTTTDSFLTNTYNSSKWKELESFGAVFLPRAYQRVEKGYGKDLYRESGYWLSTRWDTQKAYRIESDENSNLSLTASSRYIGSFIRLIQDVDGIEEAPK